MAIFSSETSYFGLDIGSTGLRLVQLKKGGDKPYLVTYGSVSTPPGLTTSDSKVDQDKVAAMIAQLVKDAKVSTKNVVAGLPASKVFASVISTPHIPEAELNKAIRYQAEQYVPMSLEQVKLDWKVVGQSKDGKQLEVLLVAAPNTATNKYLEIFEKADLEILALEANSTALSRALVSGTAPALLVDFGSSSSDLTIVSGGAPKLIRSITVGSSTLLKLVATGLGLDEVQAEQFMYKFGLSTSQLEGGILKAVKPALDDLVTEINKSAKFFIDRYPDQKLEKIVITGGASSMPEFPVYLANATGLPVEMGNAWVNVAYPASEQDNLAKLSSTFAVAVGLAERNFL